MIVEELAARFGFTVEGLEKVRRAIALMAKLQQAIAAVAMMIRRRMTGVSSILARTAVAATALGARFVASAGVITVAAGAVTAALAGVAAGFAKIRQATIDSAFISGVPVKELALIENLMNRVGASAKDGRKFVGEFVDKLREGVKDGGDWAETLSKQGVKISGPKDKARPYSEVIDDILRAADRMKDLDARRDFLKNSLPGAPDEFIVQLLQATSAFEKWKTLVAETRKGGGTMPLGDILNVGDITSAIGKFQVVMQGFVDALGSGLMGSFANDFRELGNAVLAFASDERREKVRQFAATLAEFTKDVYGGGKTVLGEVAGAIRSILDALSGVNEATGGVLGQIARGFFALGAALAFVAAGPSVAISGAITGLLWAVAKFQEWKNGGTNALSDFFDTIRNAVDGVSNAIETLIEKFKAIPGLTGLLDAFRPGSGGTLEDVQRSKESERLSNRGRDEQFERQKDRRQLGNSRLSTKLPTPPIC